MDEDNDGRFPDDSLVEVRYPLTRSEQQGDRSAWPWLPGSILGQCGPDEWHVRVEARELATLGNGSPASAGTLYGGGEQGFLGSILAQVELAVSVPAEQRGEDLRRELAQQVLGCAWAGQKSDFDSCGTGQSSTGSWSANGMSAAISSARSSLSTSSR